MSRNSKRKARTARRKNSPPAVGVNIPAQTANISEHNTADKDGSHTPKVRNSYLKFFGIASIFVFLLGVFGLTFNGVFNFFADYPSIQLFPFAIVSCLLVIYLFHKYISDSKKSKKFHLITVSICLIILAGCGWAVHLKSQSLGQIPKPTIEQQENIFSKTAQAHQWQPPELPSGIAIIVVKCGVVVAYPVSMLTTAGNIPKAINFNGHAPVNPFIKNNRLFLTCQTPFGSSEKTVRMNDYLDSEIPPEWDRNYNSNRFEVVDGMQNPVFRVYYEQPFSVIVEGVFVETNGDKTLAFGDDQSIIGANSQISKIPRTRAWFNYPSKSHLGELAQ